MQLKGLGDKNVEDNSKIDWEHVELDPSGVTMKCLFDGDSGKRVKELAAAIEKGMEGVKKEVEEADKKLEDDVKKAGIKIDAEKLGQNGLTVAGVIDNKENKKLKGKELTKKVDAAIEIEEKAEKLVKNAEEAENKMTGIKVNSKYEKMSDAELEKKLKELEAELKMRKDKNGKAKVKGESLVESLLKESSDTSLDNIAAAMAIKAAELAKDNDDISASDALKAVTEWAANAAKEQDYDSDMTDELKDKVSMIFDAAKDMIRSNPRALILQRQTHGLSH